MNKDKYNIGTLVTLKKYYTNKNIIGLIIDRISKNKVLIMWLNIRNYCNHEPIEEWTQRIKAIPK